MKNNHLIICLVLLSTILTACSNYTPKPIGYYKLDVPEKNEYQLFDSTDYPYQFMKSIYADIIPHKSNQYDDKYWIDINYPQFKGTIYCSYKPVNNDFQEMSEDSYEFVYKHTIKADDITQEMFENQETNTYGILYKIEGNAASSMQFILTDSTDYFFRGALYFNAKPNKDSIAPVLDFIHQDIIVLMESFKMKNEERFFEQGVRNKEQ